MDFRSTLRSQIMETGPNIVLQEPDSQDDQIDATSLNENPDELEAIQLSFKKRPLRRSTSCPSKQAKMKLGSKLSQNAG